MTRGGRIAKQNASKLYLRFWTQRDPEGLFWQAERRPLRSRGKETGRAGETPPPCLPRVSKTAGRTAGKRRAVPISARPCLVACAGTHTRMPFTLYMSSDTHSWHVFSKNFKKFLDRCAINIITKHTSHSECGKTARNAEATILGVLFNIRYGLGLYPDDPILRCRKRQLQHGHALILEHHGKLFQRQLYMRVLFKDLRQEETAGQNHRRSR